MNNLANNTTSSATANAENRIVQTFAQLKARGETAFIPFITGGDPDIATTEKLLHALADAGADLIEIGIPFSDPVAEGPVIEAASARALLAGCTVDKLFDLVKKVRTDAGNPIRVPILFMTYFNPIFAYGTERFIARCTDAGIDGLIVPDLPFSERDELYAPCTEANIELISLIAPTTDDRIGEIAAKSSGFLYCVSSLGVTGTRANLGGAASDMIAQAKETSDIPCCVGFGILGPEQARAMAQVADGVIVGSALVRIAEEYGKDCVDHIHQFAWRLKSAISS